MDTVHFEVGTRLTLGEQTGSVIGEDTLHGWVEIDFDSVGEQWVLIEAVTEDNT